jgi:hypothetical protein
LHEDGEEAFTAEARKVGLDPERVRLFIDILKATPADRDAIVKRIRGLYGQTGALLLQEQLDKFIGSGGVEARQKGLDDRRQDLNADAREREARQEQAYDLVRGIVGGFGGRKAGTAPRSAAEAITGTAKGEAWAVEKAVRGAGKGAGEVHTVIKPGKAAYPKEETTLYMTRRDPVAADVLKTGRPLGLMDDATFAAFKNILRDEKAKLPPDTRFAIRGSAVTGNGFERPTGTYTKDYFDVGRTSDHDIAIVSRTLFEKAREIGVGLRQDGTRTEALSKSDMDKLGLSSFLNRIHMLTSRDNTGLMIYGSVDVLNKRGANIQFDSK